MPMDEISKKMDVEVIDFAKILNFLPYPFIVSERREGTQLNIFHNNKFREEIGYTIDEIPTIDEWFRLIYPDEAYRQEVMLEWKSREAQAKKNDLDFIIMQAKIHTKNNGALWYEVKASISGPVHFVAFVNINEEIISKQELHRLNENKNRTLSILSHDLRAPLNTLRGALQLAKSLTDAEKNELLGKLEDQVFQMSDFLDTTLYWTRSNFSELSITKQPIDVKRITKSILDLYATSCANKKIPTKVSIINHSEVYGDAEILSIVFRNLVSNAIKFSPEGGNIHISDSLRDDRYVLSVENSGTGLSQEQISKILGKDHISEPGTNGEKGLGLGLKLCQQLLEKSGGHLEVESPDASRNIFRIVV